MIWNGAKQQTKKMKIRKKENVFSFCNSTVKIYIAPKLLKEYWAVAYQVKGLYLYCWWHVSTADGLCRESRPLGLPCRALAGWCSLWSSGPVGPTPRTSLPPRRRSESDPSHSSAWRSVKNHTQTLWQEVCFWHNPTAGNASCGLGEGKGRTHDWEFTRDLPALFSHEHIWTSHCLCARNTRGKRFHAPSVCTGHLCLHISIRWCCDSKEKYRVKKSL